MSTDLNVHQSLTFSRPTPEISGPIEFVSFKPNGTNSFNTDSTISVKLSSTTQFLCLERSYVKFKIATSASSTLNPLGASSIFKSVQDTLSGLSIPEARNWYIQNGIKLTTDTSERKTVTAACEAYRNASDLGYATTAGQAFTVCMPVPTTLVTSQLIPLAFFNAGYQLNYALSPNNVVVVSGSYTITDFEIVAALVTPHSELMKKYSAGLNSGNSLKVATQLYKSITVSLASSATQTLNVNTGYMSDINSITLIEKSTASGLMHNATDIKSYYINIDGQRYPKNKSIAGPEESFYQTLAGYSTNLNSIAYNDTTYQPFYQYTFKANESFGTGIPTANGTLSIELDCTGTTPPAASTLECIISYDALVYVTQNDCKLSVEL